MDSIELLSHAKINLTLEVSARRSDGYHDIDSVVQIIDIADVLSVSKADDAVIEVSADTASVPSGPKNLVYRACEAFFEETGIRAGAKCRLVKRIPVQAGLGGGSGNAAAAIVALDRLYETGLPLQRLAEIAARVGSDSPLFIYGGTARITGRGEVVEPLPDAPNLDIVVVKPDAGISTAWAYSELDRRPVERTGASDRADLAIREHDREALLDSLANSFDAVACKALAEVREAKYVLEQAGASRVMLCGSGSAVFGVFDTRLQAEAAGVALGARFTQVFVTRNIQRCRRSIQ